MAITRHSSFDRTVNTIADRNALVNKVDHMVVLVKDAIADIDAGAGKATYRYDASDNTWVLISKSTYATTSFDTEEFTITSGAVELSNFPTDNQIWNIQIIENDLIYAEMRVEDLSISGNTISGLGAYDGKTFRCTYAYGSIAAQVNSILDADTVLADLETI